MTENKTIKILGVKIDKLAKKEVLEKVDSFLSADGQYQIVTLNSEIILETQKDEEYFYILNKADLSVVDGSGLKFAGLAAGNNLERIPGADLTKSILQIAENKKRKIAILNWSGGLSKKEDVEKALTKKYPALKFIVENIERDFKNFIKTKSFSSLREFEPAILFVALGAPEQEKLIYHNLSKIPSVKLALGVGGSFDFISGKLKRAPLIFRKLGMEWLWRLIIQPWRWKRIYNAVIIFPREFIKWKFINRFFYRKNVVGFIFNNQNQVLLVNRVGNSNYWGLPQGGVNSGEKNDDAILREMKEEVNISSVDILEKFEDIYEYKWPKSYTNSGYKGQRQTLYILKFKGEDSEIKLSPWELKDQKWVEIDKLVSESDEVHKEAYEIFLEKFYS
ncbi:MAG: WecB/TagA/CpsF family glycosyltransferase [Patescibacteria group bacterium]|nr:WecB/TagA/CpsF family glycosyltransferase [Patescibacteria group bacterium]